VLRSLGMDQKRAEEMALRMLVLVLVLALVLRNPVLAVRTFVVEKDS